MDKRHGGTWYLVPPGWQRQPDDVVDDGIEESYEDGRSDLYVAMELWGLAGDAERVKQIDAVLDRAYERPEHILNAADIDELLALLDGLEGRLVGTIVDQQHKTRADQLHELRRRTTMFDLDERPGFDVENSIGEGIGRAQSARENLQHARELGLEILLG
jgi:hypothetical protein